jgi:Cof subfamily protein (haloacid dehalogenase superfamily)
MELIVFDLDGTLLNRDSAISDYTRDTLRLLSERDVAYTVATGRTLHASRQILTGHGFDLPHVYKNGVVIWHPQNARFTHRNVLTNAELKHLIEACLDNGVTPFVFTIEGDNEQAVYHPELLNPVEESLVRTYSIDRGLRVAPLAALPAEAEIANVSAIGAREPIRNILAVVRDEPHLVAYSGSAIERDDLFWMDIHHSDASKGGAVEILKEMLGIRRVICFGDSDNDLSMFELADECYAPDNAKDHVKAAATEVIGHHDEEGIAHFLRKRFSLPG